MTMIERVARAIYAQKCGPNAYESLPNKTCWGYVWAHAAAVAAIEAMRVPTEDMELAALNATQGEDTDWIEHSIWQPMIDAALQCADHAVPSQNTGMITDPPPVSAPP